MKGILLLVPPADIKPGYPRLALAYLSANLEKENIPHEIVDLATKVVEEETVESDVE